MSYYTVTLDVKVFDKEALLESAIKHYVGTDRYGNEAAAREVLCPDGEIDVGACLQQILDPGSFPGEGAQIEQSSSECVFVGANEINHREEN